MPKHLDKRQILRNIFIVNSKCGGLLCVAQIHSVGFTPVRRRKFGICHTAHYSKERSTFIYMLI